jgi:hypothetical protein
VPAVRPHRPSYASVVATLALFFALGGTALAGAHALITGSDVKDRSLTGADIKRGSLGAALLSDRALDALKGRRGPVGATGPQGATGATGAVGATGAEGPPGPAGNGITKTTAEGTDQANYVDLSPLATVSVPKAGDYVVFTDLTVHNTGASDEYLNCGYTFGGTLYGAAGVSTTAGNTSSGTSVTAFSAGAPGTLTFMCQGGGATTYDVSQIHLRLHSFG